MSPKAKISVKFWEKFDFSQIVDLLLSTGWVFPNATVRYEWYKLSDPDNRESLSVPVEQWLFMRSELSNRFDAGFTVILSLEWPGASIEGDLFFSPEDNSFRMIFWTGRPRLEGCPKMTDYSWLLKRIACPILDAGLNVEEFVCTHSYD